MSHRTRSIEQWYDIGFAQGSAAGSAEKTTSSRNFAQHEINLEMGHTLLSGSYNTIVRSQEDFHSVDEGEAWMSGIQSGVASAGGRIGFLTGVSEPSEVASGGTLIYLLVTT